MSILEIILISIALAMDAFTVALCQGISCKQLTIRYSFIIALNFGLFQAVMPFLGWLCGISLEQYIASVDHWIAFLILAFLGGKMTFDSFKNEDEIKPKQKLSMATIWLMSIATSIDALAVGISFAVLPDINIYFAVACIGIICFVLSLLAILIGKKFGAKFKLNTEAVGGIILFLIGTKILIEHLFFQ